MVRYSGEKLSPVQAAQDKYEKLEGVQLLLCGAHLEMRKDLCCELEDKLIKAQVNLSQMVGVIVRLTIELFIPLSASF